MTASWAPIRYRGYWDVPRIFLVHFEGRTYLFDCCFDEIIDDHPDTFQVYLMPDVPDSALQGSWHELSDQAIEHLGEVPVAAVRFDATRRKEVDISILQRFLKTERRKP